MGAFILAVVVLVLSVVLAFFWGFAESMATAPQYDNIPNYILVGGAILATLIAVSHWLPHIGW